MKRMRIKFNGKEEYFLKNVMNLERNNDKTKLKAKVILLRMHNKDIASIMKETKLSKRSIMYYTNEYLNKGNLFFFAKKYKINVSALSKYEEVILNDFSIHPPLTYREATLRIESLTGIKRSETQVRNFLRNKNFYTPRSKRPVPKRKYI